MDWRVHNPANNKTETGIATFEYKIQWTGHSYEVLAETTKTISKEPPPLAGFQAPTPPSPRPKRASGKRNASSAGMERLAIDDPCHLDPCHHDHR
jgi:hypothetical protein